MGSLRKPVELSVGAIYLP